MILCLESHTAYSWDMWPAEEQRSCSGYVGLTNLGATCYMATCMQHLYMIPEARRAVLEARISPDNKYYSTLTELKKMFAYLLVSEVLQHADGAHDVCIPAGKCSTTAC